MYLAQTTPRKVLVYLVSRIDSRIFSDGNRQKPNPDYSQMVPGKIPESSRMNPEKNTDPDHSRIVPGQIPELLSVVRGVLDRSQTKIFLPGHIPD